MHVRVNHLNTTLQTILSIKVTLSSTSSKNLSLDDKLVGTCVALLWASKLFWLLRMQNLPKFLATSRASEAEKAAFDFGVGTPYCSQGF